VNGQERECPKRLETLIPGFGGRRRLGTLTWVATRFHEINKARLARLKSVIREAPTKEFIAQPDAVRVDDIALAACPSWLETNAMTSRPSLPSPDNERALIEWLLRYGREDISTHPTHQTPRIKP
jgi:hypothetical protein